MLGKTTSLSIQTPEGVAFQLPLASPISRCLALMIDLGVMLAIALLVNSIARLFAAFFYSIPVIGEVLMDFGNGLMILFFFMLIMLYSTILEWLWKGKTVGKSLIKLRVVDEQGLNLTLGQIMIRNLFRFVDILPSAFYFIGGMSCLLTKRCQRLGDIAAGTIVIRELAIKQPELGELLDQIDNSFAGLPHLEARLRQNTTPEAGRIALDAILRRNELGDRERLKVFAEIANHFREAVEFPEEITIGLSDEQYVRNVVDSLFRRASA